ncbi:glycerol dehydratase reactivase beta/small subunit family protein [Brevibacillus daliensis]|uniref:glycerol dehydratase reactivase beta/small subunit family protein n=1 Tax=Brevibacillus daliensis TaxID=2892995 RepID=UPI001E3AC9EC|nr:glycerol dehydratase reactivase beta/small subunit family protein [Brevibacillus daliensis]
MIPVAVKPSITITLDRTIDETMIVAVLHGLEEEGIPYQLDTDKVEDIVASAYMASTQSPLSVGLAVFRDELVIHYKNLPSHSPLFYIRRLGALPEEEKRKLGCNAARLVKGIPFA